MCGIIGYAGHRPAVPVVMEGLSRLEYRGYDSAGVAFIQGKGPDRHPLRGQASRSWNASSTPAICPWPPSRYGPHPLGHPRRARGAQTPIPIATIPGGWPSSTTASSRTTPKSSASWPTRATPSPRRRTPRSWPTSSQRAARTRTPCSRPWPGPWNGVEGAYAVVVVCLDEPGVIHAARQSSPLVFGRGVGRAFRGLGHPGLSALHPRRGSSWRTASWCAWTPTRGRSSTARPWRPWTRRSITSPGTCSRPARAATSISCSRRSSSSPGWWPIAWPGAWTRPMPTSACPSWTTPSRPNG